MMPTVETSIWLALKSRIGSIPLGYATALPGQTYTPPQANGKLQPYLRIGRVTSAPVRVLVAPGKPHRRTGFLMVTLVYPLGQDIAVYEQKAGEIAAHFGDGVQMHFGGLCVSVTSAPQVQDGYEDNGYWDIPVRIPWMCFA